MNRDTRPPDADDAAHRADAYALDPAATGDVDEAAFARTVLATISDAALSIDEERRIVFANPAVEHVFGYAPEEILGEPISAVVPDWARDVYRDAIERYHRSDEDHLERDDVETPGRHRDGRELSLSISWSVVEAGDTRLFTGIVRDVTERKRRERRLEQFAAIGETVADGIYALDADGRFLMVNGAYASMVGYPREELIGTDSSEITGKEASERATELQSALADGEAPATLETELPTADGGAIPVEARMALFPLEDGTTGRVGVVRDITERKRYEATLAALHESSRELLHVDTSEEVARSLVETAVDVLDLPGVGIYLHDADGDVLYPSATSEYIEEIFGEMPVFGPGDESITRRAFADGGTITVDDVAEFDLTYRDDTPLRSGIWIPLGDHGVVAIVSEAVGAFDHRIERLADLLAATAESAFDRVERERTRKQYERKLEETVSKLETSNERLERFAYITSHDLKEPLRMVSSYLRLLEGRYADDLDEDAEEFIEFAVDGADRMRNMIEDLLAYSRIDTHGEPFEPVDCGAVVDRTLENLHVAVEETDATVEVGDLPTVPGDENQLLQLFQNLVENAIKYRGDDPPTIEISAERLDGAWRFSVADDGIGMEPDDTERIFEIFNRLHGVGEYDGTGIGLSLCQRIVERHGGEIRVESEPGEGSTFSFTLSSTPDA